MASLLAATAGLGAALAMFVTVQAAFLRTQAAGFLAHQQVLMRDLRVP
ncbi:hypothetical protein [Flaviaesturariibacter amylovorans]